MTILDRIFLGAIAVIMAGFAGMLALTIFGYNLTLEWLESPNLVFDGGILTVILLLLAAYLVILITRREQKRFIVYPRELGAVKISVDSVESLIMEAASQIPGLEQVKAEITNVDEPKVVLRVRVHPDFNIPQLSEELQESVKDYVQSTVGVTIQEIEVLVVGITNKNDAGLDALV